MKTEHAFCRHANDLRTAKGVAIGILLSILAWLAISFTYWLVR